jgi:thioester reductase-like protein
MSRTVLLTGFPGSFLATRLLRKILKEEPESHVFCVVRERSLDDAKKLIRTLATQDQGRVALLEGDVTAMDMGLTGKEFVSLARDVTVIHHCAAASSIGVTKEVATRVNVGGVREVLELATEAKGLERLVHWSTAMVSGGRRGYVFEEELAAPSGFRNAVEETRFASEELMRRAASRGTPVTILRPATIVGDSTTGEIDRFEGPYLLILLMLSSPIDLRVPLTGRGDVPLNLAPIDYVTDAGWAIANDRRSIGRTFHLVDSAPPSTRHAFDLIAKATGRPLPRGFLPTQLATALLRTPGLERYAHAPRTFLEQLATEVVYDNRNARELLDAKGIRCPPFESYVDVMVRYVEERQAARRTKRPSEPRGDATGS